MSRNRLTGSTGAWGQKETDWYPISKEILIYRNGDSKDRPIRYLYSNRKVRSWEELMDTIDGAIRPKYEGKIEVLYTPRGTRKIDSLDDLEGTFQDNFVACGEEGFIEIKGGYERLREKPPDSDDEEDLKIAQAQDYRKAHPVRRIYLRQEHEEPRKAKPYLISNRRKDHQDIDSLIDTLNKLDQIQLDDGEDIKYIWTEDGKEIKHPDELFVKECYVITAHRDEKPRSKKNKKSKKSKKSKSKSRERRSKKEESEESEDEEEYDYEDEEEEENDEEAYESDEDERKSTTSKSSRRSKASKAGSTRSKSRDKR